MGWVAVSRVADVASEETTTKGLANDRWKFLFSGYLPAHNSILAVVEVCASCGVITLHLGWQ
jgi:hypothetical protein